MRRPPRHTEEELSVNWDEKLIQTIVGLLARLGIHCTMEQSASLLQFIKFGVVGVTNTALSYCLNAAVLLILQPYKLKWDYVAGNLVAFFLSVLWSFYWNNKYVFKEKEGQRRSIWKTLVKTYISYAFTGILLANVLSYLWIEVFGISKFVAPVINLFISVPLNFLINKKWAFKTNP
jgi:putative flippase GtrA